jgi:hypothetical protein
MVLNNSGDQIHRVGIESWIYRDDKSRDRDRSRHGFEHRLGDLHAMFERSEQTAFATSDDRVKWWVWEVLNEASRHLPERRGTKREWGESVGEREGGRNQISRVV